MTNQNSAPIDYSTLAYLWEGSVEGPIPTPRRRTKSRFLRAYLSDPVRAGWSPRYRGQILRAFRMGWKDAREGTPYTSNPWDDEPRQSKSIAYFHAWNAGWCLARPSLTSVKYL